MIHSIGLDGLYPRQTLALTGLDLAMTGTGWSTEMVQGLGQSVIVPGSRMDQAAGGRQGGAASFGERAGRGRGWHQWTVGPWFFRTRPRE